MLIRQPAAPWPWFDEGLNVSAAAAIARDGVYALPDAQGFRVLDPAIQTGPTVIVPIAVAFQAFGVGFLQARLVIIGFALVALVGYWLLAQRLVGRRASLLAVAFLLAGSPEPMASFIPMSRQVLGEVPSLAYLLLGVLIWLPAVQRQSTKLTPFILAGLAWGIALITKSQVLLTFPAALAAVAAFDRLYYRQARWRDFVLPMAVAIGCVAVWYLAQIAIAGPDLFQRNAALLREGMQLHVLGIEPAHWRNALRSIWRTGFWLWGAPALGWGVWQARQRSFSGLQHAVLLSIALAMLGWFMSLSIGWERYIFFPAVLAPIWLAGLLRSIANGLPASLPQKIGPPVAAFLSTIFIAIHSAYLLYGIFALPDSGYHTMRAFLQTSVPDRSVIASWEWELSLDGNHAFHHPPTEITNLYTVYIQSGRVPPPDLYDPLAAEPDYILVGNFNALTGAYTTTVQEHAELVASFGVYQLFQVHDQSTQSLQ
ncbi:MAG: glycosyltransferase family 39 protein [Chloroflexales bacterium]|nr:glycosyltransferase family 39 protein [Chloroflexales bacterium]